MATGAFRNFDELLTKALGALDGPAATWSLEPKTQSFVELLEPVRSLLSEEEVDVLFR